MFASEKIAIGLNSTPIRDEFFTEVCKRLYHRGTTAIIIIFPNNLGKISVSRFGAAIQRFRRIEKSP